MTKILLDTGLAQDIAEVASAPFIVGLTTNPSLIAKGPKGDYFERLAELATCLVDTSTRDDLHFSAEVIATDPDTMFDQARELEDRFGLHPRLNLYVKIPAMLEYMPLIGRLRKVGVCVNATACMTAHQAYIASECGADIVSFFYNRMIDGGIDADLEIAEFVSRTTTRAGVICGSIRKLEDIESCRDLNVTYVTVSPAVLKASINHPKTIEAVTSFEKDIEAWLA